MEPEELSPPSPPIPETEAEVPDGSEIDITDELSRRRVFKYEFEKEGSKVRMRKWFAGTVLDGLLVYGVQKNIEVLLSNDEGKEMRLTRGGVLMHEGFAQLVLNKSCLGWQKSDEVYLCLEKDAKKVTHRTSGKLMACISTKLWLQKIGKGKQDAQPALVSSTPRTERRSAARMQPPAKRIKSESGEPANKEENENYHVIALIRYVRKQKERVFLVNDQDRIFKTLYQSPDTEAYIAAANKWASAFGTAPFVNVCDTFQPPPFFPATKVVPLCYRLSHFFFPPPIPTFHLPRNSPFWPVNHSTEQSMHSFGARELHSLGKITILW